MNEKTALISSISGRLDFEARGCRFGQNWLEVSDDICDGDIRGIISIFRRTDASFPWWIGDFLCGVERLRGKTRMYETAEMMCCSRGMAHDAHAVCAAVPVARRVDGASLHLHAVALLETENGDVNRALDWVKWAVSKAKTIGEMRSAIRASIRNRKEERNPPLAKREYATIYQAVTQVRRIDPDELEQPDREALVRDTEPLWLWLQQLQASAGPS